MVIVYGTQRIAAYWAFRNGVADRDVVLATQGVEKLNGTRPPIHVVRVSEEAWKPTTSHCERRVAEVTQWLKDMRRLGHVVTEELWEG